MFLFVHPNGSKYWRLKYRFAGKEKLLAMGVYPEVSLADTRDRRANARKALAAGFDPGEVKKENKRLSIINSENTFEGIACEWHGDCDYYEYKERHLVECFIGKIKYFRRVFSRFDKYAKKFLSFIHFASVFIWLK